MSEKYPSEITLEYYRLSEIFQDLGLHPNTAREVLGYPEDSGTVFNFRLADSVRTAILDKWFDRPDEKRKRVVKYFDLLNLDEWVYLDVHMGTPLGPLMEMGMVQFSEEKDEEDEEDEESTECSDCSAPLSDDGCCTNVTCQRYLTDRQLIAAEKARRDGAGFIPPSQST
jgi:hypothetical protein